MPPTGGRTSARVLVPRARLRDARAARGRRVADGAGGEPRGHPLTRRGASACSPISSSAPTSGRAREVVGQAGVKVVARGTCRGPGRFPWQICLRAPDRMILAGPLLLWLLLLGGWVRDGRTTLRAVHDLAALRRGDAGGLVVGDPVGGRDGGSGAGGVPPRRAPGGRGAVPGGGPGRRRGRRRLTRAATPSPAARC